jgi:hypothetical protein
VTTESRYKSVFNDVAPLPAALNTSSWNRIGAKCWAMGLAGRYRIEISSEGIVAVVDSDNRLDVARSLYWHTVMNHPNRLVMLCDRAHVIARSDQPETMPN